RASSGDEVTLGAGSLAFLAKGDPHLVGTDFTRDAISFSTLARPSVAGELVPIRIGGNGARTRWIPIAMTWERHLAEPLLAALPPVFTVDLRGAPIVDWLTESLGLNLSASDAPPAGADAARSSLAEFVIVEALRRYTQATPPGGKGWIAGLNDR